jgi:hypothetical protein
MFYAYFTSRIIYYRRFPQRLALRRSAGASPARPGICSITVTKKYLKLLGW